MMTSRSEGDIGRSQAAPPASITKAVKVNSVVGSGETLCRNCDVINGLMTMFAELKVVNE